MSPVSRGRTKKQNKKTPAAQSKPAPLHLYDEPAMDDELDLGDVIDPMALVDELMSGAKDMLDPEDPVDAEVSAALFLATGALGGDSFTEALLTTLLPAFEARASGEALAMLLAIGAVAEPRVADAASAAADRLSAAGIPQPRWADELSEPIILTESRHLRDEGETLSILACSFQRAGRAHAFLVTVDHVECGEAADLQLFEDDQLPEALRPDPDNTTFQVIADPMDPGELRWHLEAALDARAEHDAAEDAMLDEAIDGPDPFAEMSDEAFEQLSDEEFNELLESTDSEEDRAIDYTAMALLLRSRLAVLPVPTRPKPPHGHKI
ncbi:hypothetical protein [Pseudonocardia spinosispora]|uniref:hypothetical protein n=1 Tax=Pseudonocardia spinosispora TaxID=103441 RepID=UPI0004135CA8|nr:hypothetical protein [Pseudonocardia spinosispora]